MMSTRIPLQNQLKASPDDRLEVMDPVSDRYPLNTPAQVRAAWSYINQDKHARRYSHKELEHIKTHIQQMALRLGVRLTAEE